MNRQNSTALCLLALVLAASCNLNLSLDTDQANKLIDEANASNTDGLKLRQEASSKFKEILKDEPPFDERDILEAPMKEVITKCESSQAKFREGAVKFDEASQLRIPDWFKPYLSALADRSRRQADLASEFAKLAKAWYDQSLETSDDRDKRLDEINANIAKLGKEIEEFDATIDKISAEHKDDFKK